MHACRAAKDGTTESGGAKMKQDKKAIRFRREGGASFSFSSREISQTCRHGRRGVAWEEGENELGTCITNKHTRMALRCAAMSISPTEWAAEAAVAKDIAAAVGDGGIQHGDVNATGVLRCDYRTERSTEGVKP